MCRKWQGANTDVSNSRPSVGRPAFLTRETSSSQGKEDARYSKSSFTLQNSGKVCKVLMVMTLGPTPEAGSNAASCEVRAAKATRSPLSPGLSRWYFHAVAIVRVGKPPRIPARAVATSRERREYPSSSTARVRRHLLKTEQAKCSTPSAVPGPWLGSRTPGNSARPISNTEVINGDVGRNV